MSTQAFQRILNTGREKIADSIINGIAIHIEMEILLRLTKQIGGAKIYLKREDLNHMGVHKTNNTIGQVLLAKRLVKKRIILIDNRNRYKYHLLVNRVSVLEIHLIVLVLNRNAFVYGGGN